MKKIAMACALLLIGGVASAQKFSDQDLNLMASALGAVKAYKQGGMSLRCRR